MTGVQLCGVRGDNPTEVLGRQTNLLPCPGGTALSHSCGPFSGKEFAITKQHRKTAFGLCVSLWTEDSEQEFSCLLAVVKRGWKLGGVSTQGTSATEAPRPVSVSTAPVDTRPNLMGLKCRTREKFPIRYQTKIYHGLEPADILGPAFFFQPLTCNQLEVF